MTIVYHLFNCGCGQYVLEHTEINDGEYCVFVSGIVPRSEIELLMEGERYITGAILDELEYLENKYKISGYL